jgi:hypothetical protein
MGEGKGWHSFATNQLAVGLIDEPTKLNVEFAFDPRVVMAAMQTTTMRANITAYSTAVGPSSFLTKLTRLFVNARIVFSAPGNQDTTRVETEPELCGVPLAPDKAIER